MIRTYTGARFAFFSVFLVALAGLVWAIMPSSFADGSGDEPGATGTTNPAGLQQPETTSHLTTVAETGYLELEEGYVGDKLGAEVESVEIDETENFQTIDITIPVENPDMVDQVQVVGPAGKTIPQFKPAKISRDYDNNSVGVKLFLSQKKGWEVKLKLVDDSRDNPPR